MNIDRETADKYQGLFNYLNDQYGINPTIDGMNDLIAEVDKTKQLLIPLVSQQRELLVAYEKQHYTPSEWLLASEQCEKEIDDFLATNCG